MRGGCKFSVGGEIVLGQHLLQPHRGQRLQRMGDLQKASIEHVFEMRTVLSPEQGDKLLALARKILESH